MIKKIVLESGDVVIVNWNVIGHVAGWIDTLYKVTKDLENCGIVTALVLDPNDKIFVHGGFIVPRLNIPASYAMGETYYGQYDKTRAVPVSHLICAIIKKGLLEKLPLPDRIGESPFVDADYCLEAEKLGFKTYATAELIVQYKGDNSQAESPEKYAEAFEEDYKEFIKKYGSKYDENYQTPVQYHTSVGQPTGFAQAARGYIKGLTHHKVKVAYNYLKGTNEEETESDDDVVNAICEYHGDLNMPQVIWAQAPYFNKNSGKYKIGHCEFEGDTVPASWIDYVNQMDEVWVPTNWDREKFRKAGATCPIYVFAQGIDKDYFHPDLSPMRFEVKQSFKFICNAAWDPRKNLPNLIKAFKLEFTQDEDVCLIIKTMNIGLGGDIKEQLEGMTYDKDSGQVYVKEEVFKKEELGTFYTAGDCFVLPTHGEGWGLPVFEALACGIPVITTDWGALQETLRDENGEPYAGCHLLRYQKALTDTPYMYLQNNRWAEPSIPHLMETMRYVFDHKEEEKQKARETSKIIRQKYCWESVTEPIKERLAEIYRTLN